MTTPTLKERVDAFKSSDLDYDVDARVNDLLLAIFDEIERRARERYDRSESRTMPGAIAFTVDQVRAELGLERK